jgi:5-methylcytosine-specific restriction endonuclease McrA
MSKVLVLNASYEPLNITGWRRAVILMLKGKAEQIEHNGKYLYRDFPLPTVIRLRQYVTVPYREIPLTRRNILNRDNHACQYCGYTGSDLTLDHVIPRSRGGVDSWENLTTACMRCNVKKGSRSPKEANLFLRTQPRRPHSSLHYEAASQINNGTHAEWRKYVIGIE